MKKMSVRMIAEAGVMLALAFVLHLVKIYQAPQGGAVTAGSMIPLILFAIRWGVGPGALVGAVFGLLQLIVEPNVLAGISVTSVILSILLDYIIAFGLLGLSGLYRKNAAGIFIGVFLGIFGRFVSHLISGVVIWGSFAPEGMNPWLYSLVYNGTYLLPELIISIVIIALLYNPLKRYIVIQ